MMKYCPFRKSIENKDMVYGAAGNGVCPKFTEEDFLPCIGKDCAAYFESDLVVKCTLCNNTLEAKYHGSCI